MKLPDKFVEKMQNLLKDEFPLYLESFNQKRLYGLRANTLKISADDMYKRLSREFGGQEFKPVQWCDSGFYYSENVRPAKHPFYSAGLYYIQEPSAMSTGAALPIRPGDRVLDICAAPGGKTTQAAAKLMGEGVIVSNDISTSRCKALLKNIEVSGIKNAIITNETPEKLASRFENFFNKIIVDAPCSGEGMFRKDDAAVKSWESHKTDFCCTLQRDILKNAAKMLCDGGMIAYSTCTFAPEEDEGMIWEFLQQHNEFELIDVDKSKGFDYGHPEWTNGGGNELKKCGRLWPHKVNGEGHFLCLMQKKGGNPSEPPRCDKTADKKELKYFYDFMQKYINTEPPGNIIIHGSSLMSVPYAMDLRGLRVIRSGLYLGELKTKRFEPSQAFAMTLKKEEAKLTVDFALNDDGLKRYMKGESINVECADGWVLVCVEGYPLGWGKVQKNRLKNKYLPSWMI